VSAAVRLMRKAHDYEQLERKAHTGFEPVSAETEVPEPLRRKLDELRAGSSRRSLAEAVAGDPEHKSEKADDSKRDRPADGLTSGVPLDQTVGKKEASRKHAERNERQEQDERASHGSIDTEGRQAKR